MKNALPGGKSAWAAPFVLLGMAAAILHVNRDRLPARIPIHWGIHGPDRWTTNTPLHVYGSLVAGAVLCGLMVIMAVSASRSRVSSSTRPALLILLGATYIVALAIGLMPLSTLYPINVGAVILPLAAILFVVTVVLSIRSASRPSDEAELFDSPDHWRWGMFYYNPDDPQLLVERRRFGYGYTFNMARPAAWFIIASLVLVPILMTLLLK